MTTACIKMALPAALFLSLNCGNVEVTSADGGFEDAAGDDQADGGDGADTTAPRIESLVPDNGAIGVPEDAAIVITFNEAMDEASVEAAWNSSELPASAVAFQWNGDSTSVTASAIANLPLAEGEGLDPSQVAATTISVTIADSAADVTGNTLASEAALTFATQKRMRVDLERSVELTRSMREDGLVFGANPSRFVVGDSSGNLQVKTFLSFANPNFPEGAEIEDAVISLNQNSIENAPYALGDLDIFHVNGAPIDGAVYTNALSRIGVFSASATTEIKSLSVADAFRNDIENRAVRGDRTQFRLEFPTATDNDNADDEARISRSSVAMQVTYLVD